MTYDYWCDNCSKEFEVEQSIKQEPEAVCPRCQALSKKRLISSPGRFILKGNRWAKDGYS
jgi:putative FmdB family regulatory protein